MAPSRNAVEAPQRPADCRRGAKGRSGRRNASGGLSEAPLPAIVGPIPADGESRTIPALPGDGQAEAVARVLAAWMRGLESRSRATARRYGREARQFLAFLEQARGPLFRSLLDATPADCRAFVGLDETASVSSRAVTRTMDGPTPSDLRRLPARSAARGGPLAS